MAAKSDSNRSTALTLLAAVLLGSAGLGVSPRAQTPPQGMASTDAKAGQALWTNYSCYACHGYQAQGAVTGPRISTVKLPYEGFASIVRRPYGVMPAFSQKVLNETQLRNIYSYLLTVGRFDEEKKSR